MVKVEKEPNNLSTDNINEQGEYFLQEMCCLL